MFADAEKLYTPASYPRCVFKRRLRKPVAIDLFSGCGGLSLGLKQAGFRVIAAVEIEHTVADTYRVNHPEVVLWEKDIRRLSSFEVKERLGIKKGDIDLLAGCPPCQGFSAMRTLNGGQEIDDPQNDLLFQFLRFVKDLEPKTLMMENVPGLRNDSRFRKLRKELERLGYRLRWDVIDASNYGVPQRRRRFIMIASRASKPSFAVPTPIRSTVRQTIGMLPDAGNSGDPLHDLPERRSPRIMEMISLIPHDGGSRRDLGVEWQLDCHLRCNGFKDVYGRMPWDDVSPTITGGCFNPSKGRFLHPEQDRNITLREAALLQSFPPDYHFSLKRGKSNAAVMIGNALPPEFIRRHARELYRCLANKATSQVNRKTDARTK